MPPDPLGRGAAQAAWCERLCGCYGSPTRCPSVRRDITSQSSPGRLAAQQLYPRSPMDLPKTFLSPTKVIQQNSELDVTQYFAVCAARSFLRCARATSDARALLKEVEGPNAFANAFAAARFPIR